MHNDNNLKSLSRNIQLRYILALSLIALFTISTYFLSQSIIEKQKEYGHLINISGRQRMLSQKTSLLAYQLNNKIDEKESDSIKRELSEAIQLFESSYKYLGQNFTSKELKNLYFDGAPNTHDLIITHISRIRTFLSHGRGGIDPNALLETSNRAKNELLPKLERIVNQYEKELLVINQTLIERELYVVSLALITLILEMLFIFRPMRIEIIKRAKFIFDQNEKLHQLNLEKTSFLSSMAHELKTPLNHLYNKLEHNEFSNIKDDFKKINNILNQVFQLHDIDENEAEITATDLDINSLLEESIHLLKENSENQFIYTVAPSVPKTILQDKGKITFIINELITNADKFTSKGLINISMSSEGDTIILSVSDTGIGIKEDEKEKIFHRLFRSPKAKIMNIPGQGLGLSLAKEYAEFIGGSLEYVSKPQGSIFIFKFPFLKRVDVKRDLNNILIVEDNDINLKILSNYIKKLNLNFDCARNGKEAIDACTKKLYDLIFMDIQMPIMDGVQATEIIRTKLRQDCIIIATTANVLETQKRKYLHIGMNDILEKPISSEELTRLINKFRG